MYTFKGRKPLKIQGLRPILNILNMLNIILTSRARAEKWLIWMTKRCFSAIKQKLPITHWGYVLVVMPNLNPAFNITLHLFSRICSLDADRHMRFFFVHCVTDVPQQFNGFPFLFLLDNLFYLCMAPATTPKTFCEHLKKAGMPPP